jgi:phosphate:Na+ symporter
LETTIWKFIAGIGFFLYGLQLMDQALTKLSGRSFKLFLRNSTSSVIKAIAGGTLLTAFLQSSSVIALITLGFVEAGMIPFKNALAVIMGSNLGSTMTGWIVATVGFKMNIENLALPGLAISTIAMFFLKKRKNLFNIFRVFFAVSLLFYGLAFMKDTSGSFVQKLNIAQYKDQPLFIFVVIGFIITSMVQSSSATMAIALTALYSKAISFPAAAAVIIGAELGTSIKTLVAGLNGSGEKKRAAFGNFYFNIATVLLAFTFLPFLIRFITDILGLNDPLVGLAFFQSLINLLAILIFLPFLNIYSKWLQRQFSKSDIQESFINPALSVSGDEPAMLKDEIQNLLERNLDFHDTVMDINVPEDNGILDHFKSFARVSGSTQKIYNKLKASEGELLEYYVRLRKEDESDNDSHLMGVYMESLRQIIHSAKSIKDIHHNITELRESENDRLHEHFHRLQENWVAFKASFQQSLYAKPELDALMHQAHIDLATNNELIRTELGRSELGEMEASTLMNIEREILSSKKAMIRAAENLA